LNLKKGDDAGQANKQLKPQSAERCDWGVFVSELNYQMARRAFPLSFDDLAGLDAAGAYANAFAGSPDECLDGLQVHVPTTTGGVVGVGDIVAELRTLAAEITFLRHV